MSSRLLIGFCVVASLASCSRKDTPAASAPDLQPREVCPPKPNPADADRGKDAKVDWAPREKAIAAFASAKTRREAVTRVLANSCDALLDDVVKGKPIPSAPMDLGDGAVQPIDGAKLHPQLVGVAGEFARCIAVQRDSAAPCASLPTELQSGCVSDTAYFHDARNAKTRGRSAEREMKECKKEHTAVDCDAASKAIRTGDASLCPAIWPACAALVTLDASKCPAGASNASCSSSIERDKLARVGLSELAAKGRGRDPALAKAASGDKAACDEVRASFVKDCNDLGSVTPTLFPPGPAQFEANPKQPAAPVAPSVPAAH